MLIRHCTVLAYRLDGNLSRLDPPDGWRSPVHAAIGLLGVAAAGLARQIGGVDEPWQAACAVTAGLLLANTDRPFPSLG
ncbi:MAG: hypothetical protein ACR2HR_17835 [Euzebya sp.]